MKPFARGIVGNTRRVLEELAYRDVLCAGESQGNRPPTVSSSDSRPVLGQKQKMAAAVNCLVTDPMRKTVSSTTGTPCSRLGYSRIRAPIHGSLARATATGASQTNANWSRYGVATVDQAAS